MLYQLYYVTVVNKTETETDCETFEVMVRIQLFDQTQEHKGEGPFA